MAAQRINEDHYSGRGVDPIDVRIVLGDQRRGFRISPDKDFMVKQFLEGIREQSEFRDYLSRTLETRQKRREERLNSF